MEKLKQQRKTLRAQSTRIATFLNEAESNQSLVSQLEQRLEAYRSGLDRFTECQLEIALLDPEEDNDEAIADYENQYFANMARAKALLATASHDSESKSSSPTPSVVSGGGGKMISVKLPTIELPTFNGNYSDWLGFRDIYTAMIHDNDSLTGVQKLHYLKSSLRDNASTILASLPTTESNYLVGWEMVQRRYENRKILLKTHVEALLDLPTVVKESASSLRTLLDALTRNMRALESLEQPTQDWGPLLMHIVLRRLDPSTRRSWEMHDPSTQEQKFEDLEAWLVERAQVLETMTFKPSLEPKQVKLKSYLTTQSRCPQCEGDHRIYTCKAFAALTADQRLKTVKSQHLCMNCLMSGHLAATCKSSHCRKCDSRHHTLLHKQRQETVAAAESPDVQTAPENRTALQAVMRLPDVLLSTAVVSIADGRGGWLSARVVLDSGAQASFVTSRLQSRVKSPTQQCVATITGFGGVVTQVTRGVRLVVRSRYTQLQFEMGFLVVDNISEPLPAVTLDPGELRIPSGKHLADPKFYIPAGIDLLLGADVFWHLMRMGQEKLQRGRLQETALGWVVGGDVRDNNFRLLTCNFATTLEEQVTKFWQVEDCPEHGPYTLTEQLVENDFLRTTTRNHDGRFIVHIPLSGNIEELGGTYQLAKKRLLSMEKKFSKDEALRAQYTQFMQEYRNMDHMRYISDQDDGNGIYLPHHGVQNEGSLTTKLRVVFDGSCATSTGLSFNDIQQTGPQLQTDLVQLLLRFRTYTYVVTADISKMYRQIEVTPDQRRFQRILWRDSPDEPVHIYELSTVTYGLKSSPYLAIRCLHQLAQLHDTDRPLASRVITEDMYVDDLITGGDNLDELKTVIHDVDTILREGCFELRKWSSNHSDLLPPGGTNEQHALDPDQSHKILGLVWTPTTDTLRCVVQLPVEKYVATKRTILSLTARIFDPIGILTPATIRPKILLQRLWCLKLAWDAPAPEDVAEQWFQMQRQLPLFDKVIVPRMIITGTLVEVHCFADASEKAYGACIYFKSEFDGVVTVRLMCARGRVAPLKPLTIPRLELCAASLCVDLYQKVANAMHLPENIRTTFWSDSTIVLGWIASEPRRWKTFVCNRVAKIHQITEVAQWRHVPTDENPADIISRGCLPQELLEDQLWWTGPPWLSQSDASWPDLLQNKADLPEQKPSAVTCMVATGPVADVSLIEKYSSLTKLQRVIATCLRWGHNLKYPTNHRSGPLQSEELRLALIRIVKIAQSSSFAADITHLQRSESLPNQSPLKSLNAFLDADGVLRVGGRLANANVNYDTMHPMILPKSGRFTEIVIAHFHKALLHAGSDAVHAAIRQKFWIIAARGRIRHIVRQCVVCFRARPTTVIQQMGDLPTDRVTPALPFTTTGVDFGGPMRIVESHRRGNAKSIRKCYIAVFVCFTTKAVYLDLVSDLSTGAFIACLRRFLSRRINCRILYSDNATNFVGANNELQRLIRSTITSSNSPIANELANNGLKWKFIPPRSPHHGGLWEAAVKSVKYHIIRTVGESLFTYEEYQTLLTQIESVLNSRPLCPLSSDPTDLNVLTPFHFLIGDGTVVTVETGSTHGPVKRWEQIQQMRASIWKRWSKEYLHTLQQRRKWQTAASSLEVGDMVLMVDENSPPLRWPLARVVQLHRGKDGLVRVVSVRTSASVLKRAITKLCKMPIDNCVTFKH